MTPDAHDAAPGEAIAPDPAPTRAEVPDAPWGQQGFPAVKIREEGAVMFRCPEAAIAWAAASNPLRLKAHDPSSVRGADTGREERLIAWSRIVALLSTLEDRRRLCLVAFCTRTENVADIARFIGRRRQTVEQMIAADLAAVAVRLRETGVCE